MSLFCKEKFSPSRMETLKKYLDSCAENGEPVDYEIVLDGSKVIQRTSNPELFTLYEDLVTADSRVLEVIFYRGKSKHNDRRIFTFGDLPPGNELFGINIQSEVKKQVEAAKSEWLQQQIKDENEALKEKIGELEEEIEGLEEELEECKSKQSPLNGVLGEVGSSLVESYLRRNPKILNSLPLNGLGLLPENSSTENGNENKEAKEPEVTFKAKTESNGDERAKFSEEETLAIKFVAQLKSAFTQEEFEQIILILEELMNDKSKINEVIKLLEPQKE